MGRSNLRISFPFWSLFLKLLQLADLSCLSILVYLNISVLLIVSLMSLGVMSHGNEGWFTYENRFGKLAYTTHRLVRYPLCLQEKTASCVETFLLDLCGETSKPSGIVKRSVQAFCKDRMWRKYREEDEKRCLRVSYCTSIGMVFLYLQYVYAAIAKD